MRDAIRPTTTLRGPDSIRPRQLVLLVVYWVLWYLAANLALETVVNRMAPAPAPGSLP